MAKLTKPITTGKITIPNVNVVNIRFAEAEILLILNIQNCMGWTDAETGRVVGRVERTVAQWRRRWRGQYVTTVKNKCCSPLHRLRVQMLVSESIEKFLSEHPECNRTSCIAQVADGLRVDAIMVKWWLLLYRINGSVTYQNNDVDPTPLIFHRPDSLEKVFSESELRWLGIDKMQVGFSQKFRWLTCAETGRVHVELVEAFRGLVKSVRIAKKREISLYQVPIGCVIAKLSSKTAADWKAFQKNNILVHDILADKFNRLQKKFCLDLLKKDGLQVLVKHIDSETIAEECTFIRVLKVLCDYYRRNFIRLSGAEVTEWITAMDSLGNIESEKLIQRMRHYPNVLEIIANSQCFSGVQIACICRVVVKMPLIIIPDSVRLLFAACRNHKIYGFEIASVFNSIINMNDCKFQDIDAETLRCFQMGIVAVNQNRPEASRKRRL